MRLIALLPQEVDIFSITSGSVFEAYQHVLLIYCIGIVVCGRENRGVTGTDSMALGPILPQIAMNSRSSGHWFIFLRPVTSWTGLKN